MKKLILLFNHSLTNEQKEDAKESLQIEEFIELPHNLKTRWANIPPEIEHLENYLEPFKTFIQQNGQKDDNILIQGDFGATFLMILYSQKMGFRPVYATTKRETIEIQKEDKVIKQSQFKHIRFRNYE